MMTLQQLRMKHFRELGEYFEEVARNTRNAHEGAYVAGLSSNHHFRTYVKRYTGKGLKEIRRGS